MWHSGRQSAIGVQGEARQRNCEYGEESMGFSLGGMARGWGREKDFIE